MSAPLPIFGSQNLNDDDGAVIDSFLIETDVPPTPVGEPIPPTAAIEIPTFTRTLTGTDVVTTATTTYQLLPADNSRLFIALDVYSQAAAPTIEDYIIWADENNKVNFRMTQGRIRHNKRLELTGHTGAIWIAPGAAITGPIEVTYWSITK